MLFTLKNNQTNQKKKNLFFPRPSQTAFAKFFYNRIYYCFFFKFFWEKQIENYGKKSKLLTYIFLLSLSLQPTICYLWRIYKYNVWTKFYPSKNIIKFTQLRFGNINIFFFFKEINLSTKFIFFIIISLKPTFIFLLFFFTTQKCLPFLNYFIFYLNVLCIILCLREAYDFRTTICTTMKAQETMYKHSDTHVLFYDLDTHQLMRINYGKWMQTQL